MLPDLGQLTSAAETIYQRMPPTPQYRWPMLNKRLGLDLWLKHENHTPVGAYKVRGGLDYFRSKSDELCDCVIGATRGNHGQSIAFAAGLYDIPVKIVVPHGNSVEKNAAMRSLGAELIVQGDDFQASLEYATDRAQRDGLQMVPSFDPLLIGGVGTYSLELFRAVANVDVLYVPIGLGSGICGAIAAKRALRLNVELVGVVSAHANAYAESFRSDQIVTRPSQTRIADGMACRVPNPTALELIRDGVSRIVEVSDDAVEKAMVDVYECTHNVVEGAAAASVAAATIDAPRLSGKRVAAVLTGANVDREVFADIISKHPS